MTQAFDFINDLTYNKAYIYDETTKSAYSPFFINRAMSQHMDCIFVANEVNKMHTLDKQMQHDFYYYTLSAKKRYGKWAKAEDDDDVSILMKHYKVNSTNARQYLNLLTTSQLNEIKSKHNVGGKST